MGLEACMEIWRRSPYKGQTLVLHMALADLSNQDGIHQGPSGSTPIWNLLRLGRIHTEIELLARLDELQDDGHIEYDIDREYKDSHYDIVKFELTLQYLIPSWRDQKISDLNSQVSDLKDELSSAQQTIQALKTKQITGYVYVIQAGDYFKIGRTKDLNGRLTQLAIQLPEKPFLVHVIGTSDCVKAEQFFHAKYQANRRNGEWFALSDEDLAELKSVDVWHPPEQKAIPETAAE